MENEFSAKVIQSQKFLSIFSKQLITRDFEFLTDYNKVSVKVVKAYLCRLHLTSMVLDCKTVRIFAYSYTREQSNKRSGTRLKTGS